MSCYIIPLIEQNYKQQISTLFVNKITIGRKSIHETKNKTKNIFRKVYDKLGILRKWEIILKNSPKIPIVHTCVLKYNSDIRFHLTKQVITTIEGVVNNDNQIKNEEKERSKRS